MMPRNADDAEPGEDVAAAKAAGHPADGARAEVHRPSAGHQVLRDLHARMGAAHDEDRAGRKVGGPSVAGGGNLSQSSGEAAAIGGTRGTLWIPRRR